MNLYKLENKVRKRTLWHLVFGAAWVAFFYYPIWILFNTALQKATYSHILAIPLITAFLLYQRRTALFGGDTERGLTPRVGTVLVVLGAAGILASGIFEGNLSSNDWLALATFAAISTLFGYFLIAFRSVDLGVLAFPGLLMVLAIPIPDIVLGRVIQFLIWGSAHVTELLFRLTGIVYFREGVFFSLPGFGIEIAKECSGIRSSMGLLITLLLAGHFFLKKIWTKTALVVSVLPLVLIKNGIRITTLTWLAIHVDRTWLTDSILHHSGGVVFFAITLVIAFFELIWLRRLERGGFSR